MRVRVPASSANLGPGFDTLGLALSLHDRVEARVTSEGLDVEVTGEGADEAGAGEDHLVVRAMRAVFSATGGQPPGIALRCANAIPQGRGLGSSAAAIVGGALAARALAREGGARVPDADLFRLACDLEGHPDNVAACLAGGLAIAWRPESGGPKLISMPVLAGLSALVCVPGDRLATTAARRALPASVPHADAAANAARSALLVAGLTSRPEVLFDATQDFLHQRYRAGAMPGAADLLQRLRAAGAPAVVSGAGPSVLVLTVAGSGPGRAVVDSIAAEAGIGWRVIPLDVDGHGATLQQPASPGARPPDSAPHHPAWHGVGRSGAGPAGSFPLGQSAPSATHGQR